MYDVRLFPVRGKETDNINIDYATSGYLERERERAREVASNGVPFLQMRSGGSHSTPGRKKRGKKQRLVGRSAQLEPLDV